MDPFGEPMGEVRSQKCLRSLSAPLSSSQLTEERRAMKAVNVCCEGKINGQFLIRESREITGRARNCADNIHHQI